MSLIVRKEEPYNAEPRLEDLVRHYLTPEPYFFCRSHGPTPMHLDENTHVVTVQGYAFSVQELKTRFPKYDVVMAMQVR